MEGSAVEAGTDRKSGHHLAPRFDILEALDFIAQRVGIFGADVCHDQTLHSILFGPRTTPGGGR